MKTLLISSLFLLFTQGVFGQNCNYPFYDKTASLNIAADSVISTSQVVDVNDEMNKIESCLKTEKFNNKLYWLNNRLASLSYIVNNDKKLLSSCQKAFNYDKEKYCNEYTDYYLSYTLDSLKGKIHYLDQSNHQELKIIKNYCLENHLKNAEYRRNRSIEKAELNRPNSKYNVPYYNALEQLMILDQLERHSDDNINWEIQNVLDKQVRSGLDSLFNLYGFPSESKVTSKGVFNAFLILHHSMDCLWNQEWTRRFLDYDSKIEINFEKPFSFYFYRNFNPIDGMCKDETKFIEELKASKYSIQVNKYLDFAEWDKKMGR